MLDEKIDLIVEYSRKRGLYNPRINVVARNKYVLMGTGTKNGLPLIWEIAKELNIEDGAGGINYFEINPHWLDVESTRQKLK